MGKLKEKYEVINRLEKKVISYDNAIKLRHIAMTLHRWHEMECGGKNGFAD